MLDFHSEDDFLNGAMLAVQLASIHRLRRPALKVTCLLSKELAKKSGLILLKRLSELVGFMNRLLRTMTILFYRFCSSNFRLKGNLFLVYSREF